MNRKQFVVLIVVGLAVGALGFYLANKRKESYSASSFQSDAKVIQDFPLNEVAHLRIKQGTNEVNLVRGETWGVKERWNYPASFTEIREFLLKMSELKPVQDVEVGASQLPRLELNTDAQGAAGGTLVEFKDPKAANLKSIVLGKKYMKEAPAGGMGGMGGGFPAGRYVMIPESKKVWLVNESFSNIDTRPEQWLDKDFFKVEKVKSISVTAPSPTNSWSLSRESENGEWKMQDLKEGENFDPSKASTLNYALSSPSFNDVASPESKPEEIGMNEPTVAKIQTFDGLAYTVTLGSNTNEENLFLQVDLAGELPKERTPVPDEKPEDKEKLDKEFKEKNDKLQEKLKNEQRFEKWTYLVSRYTVDALLKPRTDFMAEKKEEPKEADDAARPTEDDAPPIPTLPPELNTPSAQSVPSFESAAPGETTATKDKPQPANSSDN